MAAVPDRPTNGRGTTSRDVLHHQKNHNLKFLGKGFGENLFFKKGFPRLLIIKHYKLKGRKMKETLTHEQKDFICRKLAQFIPHKQIAAQILSKFPEIELDDQQEA
jgi:hypothetical protein